MQERKDIIKSLLSPEGLRFREYVYIVTCVILLLSMFMTLYNVETYRQECVSHYESQIERYGYYDVDTFQNNFSFDWTMGVKENDGNKD